MTKDEALKMAIEAMTNADKSINEFFEGLVKLGVPERLLKIDKSTKLVPAINACKKSLEQPEPRLFLDLSSSNGNHPVNPPAQEPVAYLKEVGGYGIIDFAHFDEDGAYPVYTHPHQWQGLTNDEIVDWFEESFGHDEISETTMWFAKRLLDAVKEKNDIK